MHGGGHYAILKKSIQDFCQQYATIGVNGDFFLISNIYVLYFMFSGYNANATALMYLSVVLKLTLFVFVFFMFVSYEFFSKMKFCGLTEVADSISGGKRKIFFAQFGVLSIIASVFSLIMFLYNIVMYFMLGVNDFGYFMHIFFNILLNFFVLSIVGIVFGCAFSLKSKRIWAYVLIIFFAILSTPITEAVATTIFVSAKVDVSLFVNLFQFSPPSLDWSPVDAFGFSLLNYRIAGMAFWLLIGLAFVVFKLFNGKSRTALTTTCLGLALLSFVSYAQPSSKLILNSESLQGPVEDQRYYSDNPYQKEESQLFAITDYDLSIKVHSNMSVVAKLKLDTPDLKKYDFTLYHGYKVKKVTDSEGNELDFNQNNDYVEVHSKGQTNELTMWYSGQSNKFYTNTQGVFLPGYFPYYPHSGIKEAFVVDSYGFDDLKVPPTTKFKIEMSGAGKVYTNLEETGSNTFEGSSDGVTLLSGFYRSVNVDGIDVVYPFLNNESFDFNEEDNYKKLSKIIKNFSANTFGGKQYKRVMVIPRINPGQFESASVFSDYVITDLFTYLLENYKEDFVAHEKLDLYGIVYSYADKKSNLDWFIEIEQKDTEKPPVAQTLKLKMEELGEEYVLSKCNEYFFDSDDDRTSPDFLLSIDG